MPAKSRSQQKFFGIVDAYKKGELKADDVSKEVKDAADSMTKKEIKKFASTKLKGLPDHVKKDKKRTNECKGRRVRISESQYNELMALLNEDNDDVVVSLENQPTNNANIPQQIEKTKKAAIENGINVNDPDVKLGVKANMNGTQGTVTFNPNTKTGTTSSVYESKVMKLKDFLK